MYRALATVLLILAAMPATGQHQTLICGDCRDVRDQPQDFGNYAFNQLIEPIPNDQFSMFSTYSTSTYVWNTSNQYALVHLQDVMTQTGGSINLPFMSIPIEYSSEYVQITVTSQYGSAITYRVMETSRPLVVGNSDTAPPLPPPQSPAFGSKPTTSGKEIVCCQDGAYYWYNDQPAFSMKFSNE